MNSRRAVLALKIVLWLAALTPGAWLVGGIFRGWLGANPAETLTHVTGMTTLVLLLVTLTVTPVRRLTGWNPVIKLRRPLGLFAFAYACTHFTIWFAFYNVFNVDYMIADIAERTPAISTVSDAEGNYTLDVPLALGVNIFQVSTSDNFGQEISGQISPVVRQLPNT